MEALGAAAAALQFASVLQKSVKALNLALKVDYNAPWLQEQTKETKDECKVFLAKYPQNNTQPVKGARVIAQQAIDVCDTLTKIIDKMHPKKKTTKTVLRAFVTIMWQKDELAELQGSLVNCMQSVGRFLLQQASDENKVMHSQTFAKIEARGVENKALHGQTSTQIADIGAQMIAGIDDTSTQANNRWRRTIEQEKIKLLLDALAFPGMGWRYNAVCAADENTFRWIFGGKEEGGVKDRFASWLTSGNGVFHIAGKPGSGKSTLMRYVFENRKTEHMLEQWAAGKTLVMAACFFWKPGHKLQRTMFGLVRTLLHGIIEANHDVAQILFPEFWDAADGEKKVPSNLSYEALNEAFRRLVDSNSRLASAGYRYCFFIDGLDEYGDADNTTTELVRQLTSMARNGTGWLKICASSREYPEITARLAADEAHRLTLQELTHDDITALVDDRLQKAFPNNNISSDGEISLLRNTIIQEAKGVFLWVVLVLGVIGREAELDTPVRKMLDLVEAPHDDLDKFFDTIIDRIETPHRRTAAIIFHRVLQPYTGNYLSLECLFWYMSLMEHPAQDVVGGEDAVLPQYEEFQRTLQTNEDVDKCLYQTAKRIERYSEGLLVVQRDILHERLTLGAQVELTHRSIHEYLTRLLTTRWKNEASDFDAAGALVRMLIVAQVPEGFTTTGMLHAFFRMLVADGPDRLGNDRLYRNFQLADQYGIKSEFSYLVLAGAIDSLCHEYLYWRRHTPHSQLDDFEAHFLLAKLTLKFDTCDRWMPTMVELLANGAQVSSIYGKVAIWQNVVAVLQRCALGRHRQPGKWKAVPDFLEVMIQASDDGEGTLPMWVWLDDDSEYVEVKGHDSKTSVPTTVVWKTPKDVCLCTRDIPKYATEAMPLTASLAELMAHLGLPGKLVALAEAREPPAARARRAKRLLSKKSVDTLRETVDEMKVSKERAVLSPKNWF